MTDQTSKNKSYQEYLADKHSQLNTPVEIIKQAVKTITQDEMISHKKLIKGEVNEVYEIVLITNKSIIVRISRRTDNTAFQTEKWALGECLNAGVPVPKIIGIDHREVNGEHLTFCIENKLEGTILTDIQKSLTKNQLHTLIVDAGKVLSDIHSIPTKGFGWLHRKGESKYNTWEQFMLLHSRNKKRLLESAMKSKIHSKDVLTVITLLESNKNLFKEIAPKLLHNDYGEKHMFIKDSKVVGIIDMEECIGGDPIYEFARWEFFHDESVPSKWLIEGYKNRQIFNRSFEIRFELYRLYQSLMYLDYYEAQNYPSGIERSKRNLQSGLLYFSK